MANISVIHRSGGGQIAFFCPGCEDTHVVSSAWSWNGDMNKPTLNPSIFVHGVQWPKDHEFFNENHNVKEGAETRCHSYVYDGQITFLEGSTHHLAGKTVDLPEWINERVI